MFGNQRTRPCGEEIEAFADVIFASGTAQREYWLGEHPSMTADDIRQRYGSLKPCLHGSDAHRFSQVGEPDDDRYCWIKGELSFDTLRQACIDPASRAFVGPAPPKSTAPSQILDRLRVSDASWATTPELVLNPGLVAVIGARGSGKTALAEIVARACDAIPAPPDPELPRRPSSSFLERAGDLLGDASVTLTWEAGETSSRRLDGSDTQDRTFPRARYLSQDFVDSLCSSTTLTDELLREIERVIFEAHPILARDGALNFAELLEMRASRHRLARSREEQSILTLSDRIASEFNKRRLIDTLKDRVARTRRLIAAYTADRKRLVSRGSQHRVSRLTEVAAATEKVRAYVRYLRAQERALLALRDEVTDVRTNKAPEQLRRTRERHSETQITPDDWEPFKLDYAGDVDEQIRKYLHQCRGAIRVWRGTTPRTQAQPDGSFVLKDAVLEKLPLATLEAELKRLEKLVDADRRTQEQFAQLSGKIRHETTTLGVLQEKLKDATGAGERIQELQTEREEAYKRVFDAIVKEQQVLADLYAPLVERMSATSETLKKITFTVTRTADVDKWAESAETHLVDLRRQGPFRGRGQLRDCARTILRKPWETGDAHAVCAAMAEFRKEYQEVLLEHAVVSKTDPVQHREWLKRFATWLFSTEHISLNYRLDFGGVDIRKLSPGNRGIVLLLLYLALDYADDRPLIIDQPEENLDPKSVQDELVGLFVEAKLKRQVIMVTHNANLVVNADADQIIIAEARSQQRGALPEITYTSGGLENCAIRRAVCDILEGGEEAFRERARRLRVGLVR